MDVTTAVPIARFLLSEADIEAGKLKKSGWNSEQVTYALRKYAGKRTGMPEIIHTEKIFKKKEKNNQQKK